MQLFLSHGCLHTTLQSAPLLRASELFQHRFEGVSSRLNVMWVSGDLAAAHCNTPSGKQLTNVTLVRKSVTVAEVGGERG